ncbi:3-isopropylmalate dehydrogenase [Stanieria cyanosphaera PCC 7437]|uniref:3-isopropylmalate dehydrogenase n=1 Tax=Stanieria cyanosphaera (strain ATCC 29371 / PCC 7437) TaxID=111780 RepID=K9Y089_STAC7|nr:isocitrate/isopropylmalate family dehydrogenase [Stanieria cyanosphaera]AFZ37801.1 3-isopropylmalate dehydrogenase [Stanieria cyanosphaera PCC 7437]
MKKEYQLTVLPGEGIGTEVVDAAVLVLQELAKIYQFSLDINYGLIGKSAYQQLGNYFPELTAKLCQNSDGILFGAVSQGGLLELRKRFDFYLNVRPVRPLLSLLDKSSLKAEKLIGVDLLFVRELVSGIYFGAAGRGKDEQGDYGYHTMKYYDWEIKRIARFALQKAQQRKKLLTVAHKQNALPHLPWSALVKAEAHNFPDVKIEPMLVDTLAMQLVINPQHFDVILAGNLFGDILSDLGGALVGSIGLLGSASINANGFGMYEPVHGTAPDLAGKGIANPLGTFNAVGLMLQQWGENQAAQKLIQTQENLLAKGYRTADLYSQTESEILVNTKTFTNLFIQEMYQ